MAKMNWTRQNIATSGRGSFSLNALVLVIPNTTSQIIIIILHARSFSESKLLPGLEIIKLEFILLKQPIIALYFEFETVLKFYNLEARSMTESCCLPVLDTDTEYIL